MKATTLRNLLLATVTLVEGSPYLKFNRDLDKENFKLEAAGDISNTTLIASRAEDTLTYAEALSKGEILWTQLNGDCKVSSQKSFSSIKSTGYEVEPGTKPGDYPATLRWKKPLRNLVSILTGLKLNVDDKLFTQRWARRIVDDTPLALYGNTYSPANGVIVAQDNKKTDGINEPLNWSDLTWLVWVDSCQKAQPPVSPSNLQYIIRHEIANIATIKIVEQAYGGPVTGSAGSGTISEAKTWAAGTDPNFLAMLGSANGRGVAWILMVYRDLLGGKNIESITTQTIVATNDEDAQETLLEMIFNLAVPSDPELRR